MPDDGNRLPRRAVFSEASASLASLSGIRATEREDLSFATLTARKNRASEVSRLVHAKLGIRLPAGPSRSESSGYAFSGIAPDMWLVSSECDAISLLAHIKEMVGDSGSVCDQSDAHGVLRLSGTRVREVLSKLIPVDIHERALKVSDIAATLSGHIPVILWRLADEDTSMPVFEIGMPRSFAGSFAQALYDAAKSTL